MAEQFSLMPGSPMRQNCPAMNAAGKLPALRLRDSRESAAILQGANRSSGGPRAADQRKAKSVRLARKFAERTHRTRRISQYLQGFYPSLRILKEHITLL
ncbi:MAG TPA: hypothetical protein VNF29_13770 [Candidatus Binataceae bacterium]|nr:hypothetical protein [Candidatus Binataceae bacterium]